MKHDICLSKLETWETSSYLHYDAIYLLSFIVWFSDLSFSWTIGLTGSVILKSGRLSDVLLQLQELIKGVNEADISSTKIDPVLLAAQVIFIAYLFVSDR